ncbi:MAG TPA: ABC transporter permease [Magnetospirillaceae bacterium]|nr:ABC transporter permease [Magnetospirillaceae bacterium]
MIEQLNVSRDKTEPSSSSKATIFLVGIRRRLTRSSDFGFVIVFAVLLLVGALFTDIFFTHINISNVLRQIVANGLVSLGMLLVILTGGIDLTVGSYVALGGVLSAGLADTVGIVPAVLFAVCAGGLFGVVNGVLVAHFKLQAFIATLATMGILRGIVFLYTETPISPDHPAFRHLGAGGIGLVSIGLIIMLAGFALIWFFLTRMPTGRAVLAIGGNKEAVRLAGINVKTTIILAYVLSGALSALSGAILVSRLGIAQPSVGMAYELEAIAACVIGGAVLGGGGGGVPGTFLGVLTIGLISNLMNLLGIQSFFQDIIRGLVIILAVLARRGKN